MFWVFHTCEKFIDDPDFQDLSELALVALLVFGAYPLAFAVWSLILLICDLTCGRHYESM